MASQVQMRLAKPRSRCDFVNLVVGHLGQAGEDIFHKGVVKGAVLDIVHYADRGRVRYGAETCCWLAFEAAPPVSCLPEFLIQTAFPLSLRAGFPC